MITERTAQCNEPGPNGALEAGGTQARRYVGVDLAADPRRTGLAAVREEPTRVVVELATLGAADDDVLHAVRHSQRAGIDVPFGWPAPFVAYICAHAAGGVSAPPTTDPAWRRSMALRTTDLHVHARTGLNPLSVSTDRIAYPALRWAALESRLRSTGSSLPRDGSGQACEVYPAAALACWGLTHRGYKGAKNAAVRRTLVAQLQTRLPWLVWEGHDMMCQADDNVLDAVIAALVAREVDCGRCEAAPADLSSIVASEGWVWIPGSMPEPPASFR